MAAKSQGLGEELASLDLGDARIKRRARTMLTDLARSPDRSFPQTWSNDSELGAAYRLFSNDNAKPRAIVDAHASSTVQRAAAQQSPVLVAHDTTELRIPLYFSDKPRKRVFTYNQSLPCPIPSIHTRRALGAPGFLHVRAGRVFGSLAEILYPTVFSNKIRRMDKKPNIISLPQSIDFIAEIVGNDLHAKRILSLAGAAVGVIHAGCLGVHAIGRGLAAVEGKTDKRTIKQVDRLLSNKG